MKRFKEKNWFYKFGSVVAAFALMITTLNVNTACIWIAHQEILPKSAEKLRKF